MGEVAEMVLCGMLCQVCGGWMDDMQEYGYPRTCDDCKPKGKRRKDKMGDAYSRNEGGSTNHPKGEVSDPREIGIMSGGLYHHMVEEMNDYGFEISAVLKQRLVEIIKPMNKACPLEAQVQHVIEQLHALEQPIEKLNRIRNIILNLLMENGVMLNVSASTEGPPELLLIEIDQFNAIDYRTCEVQTLPDRFVKQLRETVEGWRNQPDG